jgi:hypothetical protein
MYIASAFARAAQRASDTANSQPRFSLIQKDGTLLAYAGKEDVTEAEVRC